MFSEILTGDIAHEGWGKTGRNISFYKFIVVLAVPAEKWRLTKLSAEPDPAICCPERIEMECTFWKIDNLSYIVHAFTGRSAHPIPEDVLDIVLEVDKISAAYSLFHWKSALDPFKEHLGEYMCKSFKHMLIDSCQASIKD